MSRRPSISVHLPKSGGTSIRRCLEAQFGERGLFDYGRGPLGPQAHVVETGLPARVEMVHGHFRPARYDAVGEAFRMTFLREPTDLLLSFYFFWRTMPFEGQALHRRFLDEQPDIEAFASWGPIRRLSSDTFFGGYDMARVDFIGFHETRHEDMARVNALAGLKLDSERHDNRTENDRTERQTVREDQALMGRLRDILADDVRFSEDLRARRGA